MVATPPTPSLYTHQPSTPYQWWQHLQPPPCTHISHQHLTNGGNTSNPLPVHTSAHQHLTNGGNTSNPLPVHTSAINTLQVVVTPPTPSLYTHQPSTPYQWWQHLQPPPCTHISHQHLTGGGNTSNPLPVHTSAINTLQVVVTQRSL